MKTIGACLLLLACAGAQQDAKVTYLATQASVQDAVKSIAHQAGLGYNWQKSFDQTDPACRTWVRNPRINGIPFATAIRQVLDPVGLRYEVENGEVVLYRTPNGLPPGATLDTSTPVEPSPELLRRKVNYYTAQKSVQYIVIDLAHQVGLGYNWDKSFAATDPDCRRFVYNLSIKNQSFGNAMAAVLDHVQLGFRLEGDQVVLYRR
jgi:hypothetical protein